MCYGVTCLGQGQIRTCMVTCLTAPSRCSYVCLTPYTGADHDLILSYPSADPRSLAEYVGWGVHADADTHTPTPGARSPMFKPPAGAGPAAEEAYQRAVADVRGAARRVAETDPLPRGR